MSKVMLEVDGLDAWYDRSHVVQGLRFHVDAGEIVTLMGRNGAGKTSTLKAIMGLLAKRGGQVRFDGKEILAQPAHARYHLGLAYVPEERRIVPGLTVLENLRLGLIAGKERHTERARIDEIVQDGSQQHCWILEALCRFVWNGRWFWRFEGAAMSRADAVRAQPNPLHRCPLAYASSGPRKAVCRPRHGGQ